MKKRTSTSPFVNMGTALLLVIFLVLTMVTFAVLSLSSAKQDYDASVKMAEHQKQYYKACQKASEEFSILDQQFEQEAHDVKITPSDSVAFFVPVSSDQSLAVTLKITDPSTSKHYCEIVSWKLISNREWQGNQTIQLLPIK